MPTRNERYDIEEEIASSKDPVCAVAYAILKLSETIRAVVPHLTEALRTDHPLQGETLDGVAEALNNIAEAIHAHGEDAE
jgi:hypothetical protein